MASPTKRQKIDSCAFFAGYQFYLHPAALSKPRRAIIENQVEQLSGQVVSNLGLFLDDGKARRVVLIVDDGMESEKLKSIASKCTDQAGSAEILKLSWLTNCLKSQTVVDTDDYVILKKASPALAGSPTKMPSSSRGHVNFESRFVCAHSSADPNGLENHNEQLTTELSKLAKAYKSTNDKWRAFGYEKAVNAIKRHPTKITSREQAVDIPGLGSKMADKIAEILERGNLRKVSEVCDTERARTVDLFTRIWGVGPSTAESLYNRGFRSLEDLKRNAESSLNKHQKVGLAHFDDLDERMSRDEAAEIEAFVRQHAEKLRQGLEVVACGSYRRGKPTCGDLDVLITHRDEGALAGLFDSLVRRLESCGFLTDHLTFQRDGNQQKYLGVCQLPGRGRKRRRLDMIVVPYEEKATALLYFTGSAHFNRSMRLLATKKGMSLSEHSLRDGVARNAREKLNSGQKLDTPTEKSVFDHIGIPYREPHERDH